MRMSINGGDFRFVNFLGPLSIYSVYSKLCWCSYFVVNFCVIM